MLAVPAIDDDVAFAQQRDQLQNEVVHRRSGLDHQHDLPWPF